MKERLSLYTLTFFLSVVIFALADPFHSSGLWVYGMSALVTCLVAKGHTKSRPKKVKADPTLARARRVWAAERELGMEPAPIFGYDPPEPLRIITRVSRLGER